MYKFSGSGARRAGPKRRAHAEHGAALRQKRASWRAERERERGLSAWYSFNEGWSSLSSSLSLRLSLPASLTETDRSLFSPFAHRPAPPRTAQVPSIISFPPVEHTCSYFLSSSRQLAELVVPQLSAGGGAIAVLHARRGGREFGLAGGIAWDSSGDHEEKFERRNSVC